MDHLLLRQKRHFWTCLHGYGHLTLIHASDFSNLPTPRQVVFLACVLLHILEFTYLPPARYPDLFPVPNVLLSTPVFVFTWLWSIKSIIEARWTDGGLSVSGEPKEGEKKSGLRMRFPSESLRSGGVSSAVAPLEGIRNRREGGSRAQSLGYAYLYCSECSTLCDDGLPTSICLSSIKCCSSCHAVQRSTLT